MSIWSRLRERIAALGGSLLEFFTAPRPPEATEGFAIAVVALGAKMAKADGRVTRDEVIAFREIFLINDEDLPAVGRFFDLARQDAAGFDLYAARIARMFQPGGAVLGTLLDALFYIAKADGALKDAEIGFLGVVAETFGFGEAEFEAVMRRHTGDAGSPYVVLGIAPDSTPDEVRETWKRLARRYHPDRLRARGVPDEAARLSERRMAQINAAYDAIRKGWPED